MSVCLYMMPAQAPMISTYVYNRQMPLMINPLNFLKVQTAASMADGIIGMTPPHESIWSSFHC